MTVLAGKPNGEGGPGCGRQAPGTPRPDAVAEAPTTSSFFLGLRILPANQRLAMYAIYGFCRSVDDIADGVGARDGRTAALDRWRADIAALYAGEPVAGLEPLARAIDEFGVRRQDFEAVIDGMAMDAEADIVAPERPVFDRYVDRVASAPGRLSVRVFGLDEAPGIDLSHHLGRALQITNILRDIDEDAARGRLYLPREALAEKGIALPGGRPGAVAEVVADPRLAAVCAGLAAEAGDHFAQADAIMDAAPRRAVRAPRLMAAAYRSLLGDLAARGWRAPRRRVAKRRRPILLALLRHGFF